MPFWKKKWYFCEGWSTVCCLPHSSPPCRSQQSRRECSHTLCPGRYHRSAGQDTWQAWTMAGTHHLQTGWGNPVHTHDHNQGFVSLPQGHASDTKATNIRALNDQLSQKNIVAIQFVSAQSIIGSAVSIWEVSITSKWFTLSTLPLLPPPVRVVCPQGVKEAAFCSEKKVLKASNSQPTLEQGSLSLWKPLRYDRGLWLEQERRRSWSTRTIHKRQYGRVQTPVCARIELHYDRSQYKDHFRKLRMPMLSQTTAGLCSLTPLK